MVQAELVLVLLQSSGVFTAVVLPITCLLACSLAHLLTCSLARLLTCSLAHLLASLTAMTTTTITSSTKSRLTWTGRRQGWGHYHTATRLTRASSRLLYKDLVFKPSRRKYQTRTDRKMDKTILRVLLFEGCQQPPQLRLPVAAFLGPCKVPQKQVFLILF